MNSINKLSDNELLINIRKLNSTEIKVMASLLLHLSEVGKRRLYASQGYTSLFAYCVEALKYCEGTAGRRIIAARCVENFPALLDLFLAQKINLTTIVAISKILTASNYDKVITNVCEKSKTEVEKYLAIYLPEKSVREFVRVIPGVKAPRNNPIAQGAIEVKEVALPTQPSNSTLYSTNMTNSTSGVQYGHSMQEVKLEVNYEVKIKAKNSAIEKLRRVQELRGPKESLGELFEVLLDSYIERNSPEARRARREKRRAVAIKKVSGSQNIKPQHSRHIPTVVRDNLHLEYQGQCAFVSESGLRCSCRAALQVDHIYPYGLGGSSDNSNLRLLCRTHNRLVAENIYGTEKVNSMRVREEHHVYSH
jgi:5-methylcytosine-specific restriction endonuclease McrA